LRRFWDWRDSLYRSAQASARSAASEHLLAALPEHLRLKCWRGELALAQARARAVPCPAWASRVTQPMVLLAVLLGALALAQAGGLPALGLPQPAGLAWILVWD
jgi:hypothetical protein